MATSVFISYRHAGEAAWATQALFKELETTLGKDVVFRDDNSLVAGENFESAIKSAIATCFVGLIVINENWLQSWEHGVRKNPKKDWVFFEIETLVEQGVPILPIILYPAKLPDESLLPLKIRHILKLHAVTLYPGQDIKIGIESILKIIVDAAPSGHQLIEHYEAVKSQRVRSTKPATPIPRLFLSILASLLVCLLLVSFGLVQFFGDRAAENTLRTGILKSYKNEVDLWIATQFELLEELAKAPVMRSNDIKKHATFLTAVKLDDNFPRGIYTLDQNGYLLGYATPRLTGNSSELKIQEDNFNYRNYFIETKSLNRSTISTIIANKEKALPIIVVASPRSSPDGRFIGIIDGVYGIEQLLFSELAKELLKANNYPELEIYLADKHGKVLASNVTNTLDTVIRNNDAFQRFLNNRPTKADLQYISFEKVKHSPFYVVVQNRISQ